MNERLTADFHLQMLREAEWRQNHPMRDRWTQVGEFQLQEPYAAAPITRLYQPSDTGVLVPISNVQIPLPSAVTAILIWPPPADPSAIAVTVIPSPAVAPDVRQMARRGR